MLLTTNNINTKFAAGSPEERDWLREYLSFENTKARYVKSMRGDGRIRMFSAFSNTFPSGFLPLVQKAATEEGMQVQVIDQRKPPCARNATANLGWLYDYQLAAVEAAILKTRGILWMPTGAGKTEILPALTLAMPCRWLFIAHRSTLMMQAAERYEKRTGITAGRCGEGLLQGFDDGFQLVCATFQTLYAGLRKRDLRIIDILDQAQGLIPDEAHVLPSESYWQVAQATPNAYMRIGLSATPLARGDRRSVLTIASLGPVIYRLKPDVLISRGVLAKPKIRMLPVTQTSIKPTWQGVYGECIVRSKPRNQLLVDAAKRAAKPCLVFVKEVKHGKALDAALQKAGVNSAFVWGTHSTEWRKTAVKSLERGAADVLVCSVIFQEGVDIPCLASVVIGSGGKSVIAALQRVGRGMRSDGGKKATFEVFDVKDKGNKWLERHSRDRQTAYLKEGYEVIEESTIGASSPPSSNATTSSQPLPSQVP